MLTKFSKIFLKYLLLSDVYGFLKLVTFVQDNEVFLNVFGMVLLVYLFLFCLSLGSGADLGFSRGGGGGADFQKIFENFVDLFFGRPNSFFELSQSTVLSLFWPNFLRRRQNFEKIGQKRRF